MQTNPQKSDILSPFFGLLAEAEDIEIQEMHPELSETGRARSFLVRIRKDTESKKAEWGFASDKKSVERSAHLLLQNEDYILARNLFSYLLKENLRDIPSLRGLGICFYRLGENASAKRCFRAVDEMQPTEEVALWLGFCCAQEGDDKAAIEQFKKYTGQTAFSPSFLAEYFRYLGNSLLRLGDTAAAQLAYENAEQLAPNSDTVKVNLGTLYLRRNEIQKADRYFDEALKINNRSAKAYCGKGLVFMNHGELAVAEQCFYRAVECDGQNQLALEQLLILTQNAPTEALANKLKAFLEKEPKHLEFKTALAQVNFKLGKSRDAETLIAQVLEVNPSSLKALELKNRMQMPAETTGFNLEI